jgi:hypothetical protein
MSFFWLRTFMVSLAGLLGFFALWTLITELVRPQLAYFPADSKEAVVFDTALAASVRAAHIGSVRGDLWSAAAVAEAAPLLFAPASDRPSAAFQTKIESAERTALHAARLSPHDSRVWLVLADLRSRRNPPASSATEILKLSYYTGPNEFALAPVRLLVAARVAADDELQEQIQSEIQRVILKRPDLKGAIAAAYKTALPRSREIFEAALLNADPDFLATITPPRQRP